MNSNDCDIKLSTGGDLGVSDQELQALLSQNDIATSLAEDLLKHFGSPSAVDDIDIKDELDLPSTQSKNHSVWCIA